MSQRCFSLTSTDPYMMIELEDRDVDGLHLVYRQMNKLYAS